MIQTLKSSLLKPAQLIPATPFIIHRPTYPRFIKATPNSNQEHQESMEAHQQEHENVKKSKEDVMSHSFGEGYKTRSDEEGFGGVYGGNQSEEEQVDVVDVNHVHHPEYDKSQGSEVKEKEKARNQMEASS